jgi:putative (di)nucleoside polyphosphate hydrolase
MPSYRPNAAIILRNSTGEILVCERRDWRGCWQFPQGGVKKSESLLDALHREVEEELGLTPSDYRILSSKGPYRYLFMNGRKKDGFDGQEQTYFLALLTIRTSLFASTVPPSSAPLVGCRPLPMTLAGSPA